MQWSFPQELPRIGEEAEPHLNGATEVWESGSTEVVSLEESGRTYWGGGV